MTHPRRADTKRLTLLFLAGRDARHSKTGGGDAQAWAWAVCGCIPGP